MTIYTKYSLVDHKTCEVVACELDLDEMQQIVDDKVDVYVNCDVHGSTLSDLLGSCKLCVAAAEEELALEAAQRTFEVRRPFSDNMMTCKCGEEFYNMDDRHMDALGNVFCSSFCLEKYGQFFPSFEAQNGRPPIAGKDYNEEKGLCQDDYEYLTGTGRYSNTVQQPKLSWRDRWNHWLHSTHCKRIGDLEIAYSPLHALRIELDKGGFFTDTILFIGEDGGDVIEDRQFVICIGDYTRKHIQIEFALGTDAMNTLALMWDAMNWINIHWGDERGLWARSRFLGKPFGFEDQPIDEFPF